MTSAGRRSSRLTSLAAPGGGTAAEDPETQAIILRSLQAERTVVEQLRAALPPPDDDWSESGGDALPGAAHEVDYVEPLAQFGDTTAVINDDSGAVGVTQGAAEGAPTHEALRSTDDDAPRTMPGLLTMCANHERCGRTQAATVSNPGYCCDECERTSGREHAENCCVDQTTDSQASEHVFGSAEMEATLNDTKPAAMDF